MKGPCDSSLVAQGQRVYSPTRRACVVDQENNNTTMANSEPNQHDDDQNSAQHGDSAENSRGAATPPGNAVVPATSGAVRSQGGTVTTLSPAYGPYLQTLPATRALSDDEQRAADIREGIHPTASTGVDQQGGRSLYELLALLAAVLAFVLVVALAFPWRHFIKTAPKDDALLLHSPLLTERPPEAVKNAMAEITVLRETGRLNGARDKCAEYLDALPTQQREHILWLPIWQQHLELLFLLRQHDDLRRQCSRLRQLVPDAVEAVYYPAKLDIDTVPRMDYYTRQDRKYYGKLLAFQLKKCAAAEAALATRKPTPAVSNALKAFRLLMADCQRRLWWLSNYSWDDDHREEAFAMLCQIPEDSRQALQLRLSLLRDCRQHWRNWWQRNPGSRIVDGRPMTDANVEQEIELHEQLLRQRGNN
ncbi:MAG: hypothetical protein GX617_13480 [Lentisphaerae bacterium]|nr:hypothetical protein [Lentisphaerota bacterium]